MDLYLLNGTTFITPLRFIQEAMEEAATQHHAHPNTVYHRLYAYYNLGYDKKHFSHVFNKSERTLRNWIKTYK
ncbi:hypothetical protein PHMEG_00020114 [Phytophthora megakarya]|uniref:Transposase n=1 Tax=Phytophthora megakarya TaxID=4795 RepID=A0A225VR39_9STRA|nr:hypothetical protein PHMEG_00020114 [Phytophthora megakarya]